MFVSVARLNVDVSTMKAKRHVLRQITDRVQARFNVSVAQLEGGSALALAVVSHSRSHACAQLDKICHFIEELYIVPIVSKERETFRFGEEAFPGAEEGPLPIPKGNRSLAEAEGQGAWANRHLASGRQAIGQQGKPSLDVAKSLARRMRHRARGDLEKDKS